MISPLLHFWQILSVLHKSGFFCAVFQWVRVTETSGTLSFWAKFVEFFGKNCLSFEFFWKSCWVLVKYPWVLAQNPCVFNKISSFQAKLAFLCHKNWLFKSKMGKKSWVFFFGPLSFEKTTWKPPGAWVLRPKIPWVFLELEFFSPWVFRKRTKKACFKGE